MRAAETLGTSLLPILLVAFLLQPVATPTSEPKPAKPPAPQAAAQSAPPPVASGNDDDAVLRDVRPVINLLAQSAGRESEAIPSRTDRQALRALAQSTTATDIGFLIATLPDYIDSNSGWMADEIMGGIQAAMAQSDLVLDRFVLPELTRPDDKGGKEPAQAASGVHERQPGALIFRNYKSDRMRVVLLALETPTSGIHRTAFDRAARLIDMWLGERGSSGPRHLRILGPTFSGSAMSMAGAVVSLASVSSFSDIDIVTGTATSDDNEGTILKACASAPRALKCFYNATTHSNAVINDTIEAFLRGMNDKWFPGRVALLVESNTTFGRAASSLLVDKKARNVWQHVRTFHFPLHIAQLRGTAAPSVPNLLNLPAPSLDLRETFLPSDQLPPMRPELVSAVTAATVDAILDAIRHEGFSAVGFLATDARDILFLSREVKRAAPDVQLFYPMAHRLYLHPAYVPYTRGALVASTYPLWLAGQTWNAGLTVDSEQVQNRESFQSTFAEGVFNATLVQLDEGWQLVDYTSASGPTPDIWISVVGDDGFWPLGRRASKAAHTMPRAAEPPPRAPQRLPGTALLALCVLALFIAAHLVVLAPVADRRRAAASNASARERLLPAIRQWSLLRPLASPVTLPPAARKIRLARAVAVTYAAALAFWLGSMLLLYHFPEGVAGLRAEIGSLLAVAILSAVVVQSPMRLRFDVWSLLKRPSWRTATHVSAAAVHEVIVAVGFAAPALLLAAWVWQTYWAPGANMTTALLGVERTFGGGIVSTGPVTVCLFAALYVPLAWSLRHLSMLGDGFDTLTARSATLHWLLGGAQPAAAEGRQAADEPARHASGASSQRLAQLLDMPLQRLPRYYWGAIAVAVGVSQLALAREGSTVDGPLFSMFLRVSSIVALAAALALIAQSVEIGGELRRVLTRLREHPFVRAFARLHGHQVSWNVSLVPPHPRELQMLVRLAASLRRDIGEAGLPPLCATQSETALALLASQERVSEPLDDAHAVASLTQSPTWRDLWGVADVIVPWLPALWAVEDTHASPGNRDAQATGPTASWSRARVTPRAWLERSETLVAGLCALALRDIVARIMGGLFAAMLCLGLLTAAHLLYLFQGRSSFLTLDMMAIGIGSTAGVWALIAMEKDVVLSLIWQTTPGRVTFSWGFVQRMLVYGVVPLVIVVGSLFPEIGEPLLRLLEPLRRLTAL